MSDIWKLLQAFDMFTSMLGVVYNCVCVPVTTFVALFKQLPNFDVDYS